MIVAGSLAFYSLLPQLANVDETVDALGNANLWWLPAIIAASIATYVFATVSALGAYSLDLSVLATFRSQVASSFTALVAPANAGGMALGVRFLQKAGFTTPAASSAVGLNALGLDRRSTSSCCSRSFPGPARRAWAASTSPIRAPHSQSSPSCWHSAACCC